MTADVLALRLTIEDLNQIPHIKGRLQANPVTGCWEWQGYRLSRSDGLPGGDYGQLRVKEDGKHRSRLVHRYVWAALNGEIPDGLHVCHRCDNPPCANPGHLLYTPDNTYIPPGRYRRMCRACRSTRGRATR
jgi:hypothetical protein